MASIVGLDLDRTDNSRVMIFVMVVEVSNWSRKVFGVERPSKMKSN